MEKIANKLTDLVGNTPLLKLANFQALNNNTQAQVVAKLEYFNPAGSIKDRVALAMILDAEERGVLQTGGTIIEPTSGNTGVGLAFVAASRGYKLILTMPETMSIERRMLLAALGAKIELTAGATGMSGAIKRAQELQESIEGSIILNQFENGANPRVHYLTTSEEIWRDTQGKVDIIIGGVGTGGTISGIGQRLKELNPNVEVIAVEPASSPVLSGGCAGPHKIQGIGAGFIPKNYNADVVDRIITVDNDDAFAASRNIATSEGLLVGISSGAALHAAMLVAAEPSSAGKRIVVILPQSGERYL
ncbi:MAG: cysteine synthase A, partial [Rikenellaceae bacterium]